MPSCLPTMLSAASLDTSIHSGVRASRMDYLVFDELVGG